MNGNRVCAVMVTHNPGPGLPDVYDSFKNQVSHLVIVDNASSAPQLEQINQIANTNVNHVTLISNSTNNWLAGALNQGTDWAMENGYDYVLMMNDGNYLSPNAVSTMLLLFRDPTLGQVGSVNPRVIIGTQPSEVAERPPVDDPLPVTAGCLISATAMKQVGPQREDFLVDMIDYDYAFRLRRLGFRTLQLPSVSIACELGRTTSRRFLWRRCNVENYSPIRRYYFARNGLTLVRETRNKALAQSYSYFLLASIAKIVLYEKDKTRKLAGMAKGIADSLRGRLGPKSG